MPLEAIEGDLSALGLEKSNVKRLLEVMEVRDLDGVEAILGKESPAADEVNMDVGWLLGQIILLEVILLVSFLNCT